MMAMLFGDELFNMYIRSLERKPSDIRADGKQDGENHLVCCPPALVHWAHSRKTIMQILLKQSIIIGCSWIFLGIVMAAASAQDVPAAVKQAAEQGVTSFLQAIPAQDLAHFNFSDPTELERATLGEPFLIYTIAPESILAYQAGTPVEDLMAPTSLWYVPVLVNGESRTLLMIDLVGGTWKAVGIGGSGIAKQWSPADREQSVTLGYTPRFVRIFQATADFVVLSHRTSASKMVPLASARTALASSKIGEEYAPSVIIPQLQHVVRENLETSQTFK